MRNKDEFLKMILAALFAALTCIATMLIELPSFGPSGYINVGDTMVLLSAWILGGAYGAFAAGLGSGLADLLSGYVSYVPGTFAIKLLMALAAFYLFNLLHDRSRLLGLVLSAVTAEVIMIAGYFVFEALFLGYGLAAAPAIFSNMVQGIGNVILGCAVYEAFVKAKVLKLLPVKGR